ncbi:MAG: hydroxyethylthiazole kinase [Peptoniphilaceae bacterium]
MKSSIQEKIYKTVEFVKVTNPMAGSITNSVTIEFVANAQLAVGGSAAMVYLPDEALGLAKMGNASYINVGTLLPIYEYSLPEMVKKLKELNKPWVLDPVAVGLGKMRTNLLKLFKEYPPAIIRGNSSEIIALAGLWDLDGGVNKSKVRGVDSTDSVSDSETAAISLAKYIKGAVAVSGKVDLITDGKLVFRSYGGSHFMEKITGAGCSLGGVMAVYLTGAKPLIAALTGVNAYNLAGKLAEKEASGPASFKLHFIDKLYNLRGGDIANNEFTFKEL